MPRKNQQQPTNSNPNCRPKKKGHHPAHQNKFAYKHNPKSKLTDKILASPNVGLCRRCHDKIEWRKKYRKYKPLTQPATCNLCKRRNITAAYHTICDACAVSDLAHDKMMAAIVAEQGEGERTEKVAVAVVEATREEVGGEERGSCDDNEAIKTDPESISAAMSSSAITTNITSNNNSNTSTKAKRTCKKVCAMCVKEPAKADEGDKNDVQTDIEEQINAMEIKLKRPLKLRETKAIERKVQRAHEKEKERLKEERRRAREREQQEQEEAEEEEEEEKQRQLQEEQQQQNLEGVGQGIQTMGNAQGDRNPGNRSLFSEKSIEDDDDDDYDDNDPFVTAIGGRNKLLTGDAYQKMMLEEEKRFSKIQISN